LLAWYLKNNEDGNPTKTSPKKLSQTIMSWASSSKKLFIEPNVSQLACEALMVLT